MAFSDDESDMIIDSLAELTEKACMAVALAKEKQSNTRQVIYADDDGNDALLTVYGWRYHSWKSGDTLDLLANKHLGSPDYADIIAYFNGIKNEAAVNAGEKIKIPILTQDTKNERNKIYAEPEKQDSYGADIELDDEGDFSVIGGSFKTISGKDNLAQGVFLRLATATEKRIRLSTYGIRAAIGDALAVESYLISAITQTVQADPRISSIKEISVKGSGDKIYITISCEDINGEASSFEGEV